MRIAEVPLWARAKRLVDLRDADGYTVDEEAETATLHYVGDDVPDVEVGRSTLVGHTQAYFDGLEDLSGLE
ncbi:hypothetical protein GCM10008995_29180 [Halobellus salinus]|uniref:Uncharacterized protein n=1 Tax=Halobellus salinus TaxID=931585 RepID=A0A830ELK8_9EURY|nr:hypothetical protein [Halobellus salinus]GGJ17573.1 hypothetical protein GCM10008995_29180 [Halobellus salinus]SMP35411.1 hypothetical protein SAMN06265347_13014 [Halobellus salinus]